MRKNKVITFIAIVILSCLLATTSTLLIADRISYKDVFAGTFNMADYKDEIDKYHVQEVWLGDFRFGEIEKKIKAIWKEKLNSLGVADYKINDMAPIITLTDSNDSKYRMCFLPYPIESNYGTPVAILNNGTVLAVWFEKFYGGDGYE